MAKHILTSLGKQRAWREGVLKAPQLRICFDNVTMKDLIAHCEVQDLRLSSYENVGMTERYKKELPDIILGESDYWMLWKALVTDDALELYYIDQEKKSKHNYRKCSVLLCRISWFDGLFVRLSADPKFGEWEDISSTFAIEFRIEDDIVAKKRKSILVVKYRILDESHRDTYAVTKKLES